MPARIATPCVAGMLAALVFAAPALAQSVTLTGSMGTKALLVIDGGAPKALAAGETHQGVKVLRVGPQDAVVERAGQRYTLALGGAPIRLGGGGGGARIVLSAGPGGHFTTDGRINGGTVQFLVDTGASYIAMSRADAERLGVSYKQGQTLEVHTANGRSMAHRILLSSVRIQDVELNQIEALVTQEPMQMVLLGNSFLNRFQMQRENDTLTLTRRY